MTRHKDKPVPPPDGDDNAPSGVTVDPGDGGTDEAGEAVENTANATSVEHQQVSPAEPATAAGDDESKEDLADELANDEAAEVAATMVGSRNAEESSKSKTTVRFTRSSARAADERVAAQEQCNLRLDRRATEWRVGDANSTHRTPQWSVPGRVSSSGLPNLRRI